jgi:hypothetical protein
MQNANRKLQKRRIPFDKTPFADEAVRYKGIAFTAFITTDFIPASEFCGDSEHPVCIRRVSLYRLSDVPELRDPVALETEDMHHGDVHVSRIQ